MSQWLAGGIEKWTKAKAAAAVRERELQDCINQLNNEFFNKLAASRPRRVLPPAPATPVHNKRMSMSATAKSNQPAPSTPIPANKRNDKHINKTIYIPDPKNPLDVELSHIVNASPHRVTVKMIPGEVGKYWFGDENPRLVYCRILPSQMVMVRVGGGWVELSK